MSGPQKLNYFIIWAIWGSVRAYFPIISYYLGVPPGSLLAPSGSSVGVPINPSVRFFPQTWSPLQALSCAAVAFAPQAARTGKFHVLCLYSPELVRSLEAE